MIALKMVTRQPVTHVVFSPDGNTIAVSQPHFGVTLLDRATGHTIAVCAQPRRDVLRGLTFCGGGRFVAAGSAKWIEAFDATTGELLSASCHWNLLLTADDTRTTGIDPYCRVVQWEPDPVTSPCSRWRGYGHNGSVAVDALSPDGRFAILDTRTRPTRQNAVFDLRTGRAIATVQHNEENPKHLWPGRVNFCPTGQRFAIHEGPVLRVYEIGDRSEEEPPTDASLVQRGNGATPPAQTALVAPTPHAVLTPVLTLRVEDERGNWDWPPAFAFVADGRGLLVKRPRNHVQLWDVPTGTLVNDWSWQFECVTCVAVSADGLTAAIGGRFGRVLIWDLG
ncbi:wd-40 repeat protein : G-protein beta WD-40 repeats containing protein, putative OS=Talaromyces stipitatus (strain ATCC 10500 / CBS 375.48 / QM 6759 / NRRL 1006) GN=TSTA_062310 PE=4 SV=1 [Gemmata massiliana]|uniref:Wd-40 repeat protein: G-protein beta WD-40 repeats containing protein, putative n=1 Tax=Gemmata massiliana TaxID=1210884 RepID=A0A6P2DG72_9BACT|nr:WD40 repeat domain-containing protein [Gemmata massiliana]VTR99922.1 wd-40 repeat protein : G-protein beta WD-40 repeats containing protein, putative OS=Talaromyces stipitatus (strain ATCC 10500 / CBS 375.48 / QM 6759 / NRRL 1006) GN=TSTA_062310 PE=4 SV=1 [Gemmata massiliana]